MAFRNFMGCAVAAVTAGPVFVASLGIVALVMSPEPVALDHGFVFALLFLLPSLVVGIVVAFIPVTIGTMAMGWLGERNAGLRLPVAWALAGAGMGGGWTPFVMGPDGPPLVFAFTMTGAISALICRHWLVWTPAPERYPTTPPATIA